MKQRMLNLLIALDQLAYVLVTLGASSTGATGATDAKDDLLTGCENG